MKILVYGVGVIGSFLIHSLKKSRNDITLVARDAKKEILDQNGLIIHHVFQKKTSTDHLNTVTAAPKDHFDLVISAMQGQQQIALLPTLAGIDAELFVLVGNNLKAEETKELFYELRKECFPGTDLKGVSLLFAFQGTAGVWEDGQVECVHLGHGSMSVGGLHRKPDRREKELLTRAFSGSGYQLRWVDDMQGWLWCHAAFVLPIVYASYACGCDLRKADKALSDRMMAAIIEAYQLLDFAGVKIRPVGDRKLLFSKSYAAVIKAALRLVAKTKLGDLLATDHCANAVAEMEWLDQEFEAFRSENPSFRMPAWEALRMNMPSWEEVHQTYDKEGADKEGAANPGMAPGRADYRNWVPKGLIYGCAAGTGALGAAACGLLKAGKKAKCPVLKAAAALTGAGTAVLGGMTIWCIAAYRQFSYRGKRKLSKDIVEGIATYVTLPEGGVGLDVGCGSGALTIACAKKNPQGKMMGLDRWGKEYASFSKALCERNARAEGAKNVSFTQGDALKLDFEDETFDAVTSNYVYHNIPSKDRQSILMETLRVLKKGGSFAIHDIFTKARYGDMQSFVRRLRDMGYETVELIPTAKGMFMEKSESVWMGLSESALLVGRK